MISLESNEVQCVITGPTVSVSVSAVPLTMRRSQSYTRFKGPLLNTP